MTPDYEEILKTFTAGWICGNLTGSTKTTELFNSDLQYMQNKFLTDELLQKIIQDHFEPYFKACQNQSRKDFSQRN